MGTSSYSNKLFHSPHSPLSIIIEYWCHNLTTSFSRNFKYINIHTCYKAWWSLHQYGLIYDDWIDMNEGHQLSNHNSMPHSNVLTSWRYLRSSFHAWNVTSNYICIRLNSSKWNGITATSIWVSIQLVNMISATNQGVKCS